MNNEVNKRASIDLIKRSIREGELKDDKYGFLSHTLIRMGSAINELIEEEMGDSKDSTPIVQEYAVISALLLGISDLLKTKDLITLNAMHAVIVEDRVGLLAKSLIKRFNLPKENATSIATEIENSLTDIKNLPDDLSLIERKEKISDLIDGIFARHGIVDGKAFNPDDLHKADSYDEIVKRAKEQLANLKDK